MSEPVIETVGLKKSYKAVEAVCRLDLSVPRGSVYGFLGRNGAGKTTTIKMLLGMVAKDAGTGSVLGYAIDKRSDSLEIRRRTGFVSEDKGLYDYMTVGQMIEFTRPLFPGWRRDRESQLLRAFDLPPARKVKQLSKGMRTKIALLLALSRGAELLILDEPTEGLDPAAIEEVLQVLVRMVAEEEVTIFFSSHQIAEVEQIADHVLIINRGRAVVAGALDDVKENYRRINLTFDGAAPAPSFEIAGIERIQKEGRQLSLLVSRNLDEIIDQARALRAQTMDVVPVTLKEIFLETVRGDE
ncbi:MAG TPA: ABC transporter ATP-binding protein [Blastocatellia bacterium]|nr:ABC transporter ATP-binding protein [Blastocatellia bacterium]